MKIILTAVNAKYIHSNLAVYTLQASAEKAGVFPEIREFTINQSKDSMLRSLFLARADVVCVSCYIWNISIVEDLITEYHKISPKTKIWLGGPEVSYHAEEMLEQYPFLAGIMKGEGEVTFREIAVYYQNQGNGMEGKTLEEIHGITYRDADGAVKSNPWRPVMDLSEVDFPYANLKKFENRIIYYESSRGCPFSCSYCLSSIDKRLRFRNLDLVKKELAFFLEQKVPQVKFVDRTFNCKKDHAMAIWKFIAEHDNGVTNFHFEIAGTFEYAAAGTRTARDRRAVYESADDRSNSPEDGFWKSDRDCQSDCERKKHPPASGPDCGTSLRGLCKFPPFFCGCLCAPAAAAAARIFKSASRLLYV